MWKRFLLFALWVWRVTSGVSLMGLGGYFNSFYIVNPVGGGGMVKGSSFSLDTKDPRKTRVHGNSLQIDLDSLEFSVGGGVLRYLPTHVEFETGLSRWISRLNEEKVSIHYNDKVVLQLYSPDESPYFQFSMPHGNAVFRDVLLDKSLNQKISLQVCLIDSIFDPSITVESCHQRSAESATISSHLENLALSMVFLSEKVLGAEEMVSQSVIQRVNELFIHPLFSNITTLSTNLTHVQQFLESKILQSSQEMATRTLNSFRNLSSTLSGNLTSLRDSFDDIFFLHNQTIQKAQNEFQKEIQTSNQLMADLAWKNMTFLEDSLRRDSGERIDQLASVIHQQLIELNSTIYLSSRENAARINSTDQRISHLDSLLNSSITFLESSLSENIRAATSHCLSSLHFLNATLSTSIIHSHHLTLSYLNETRLGIEGNLSAVQNEFNQTIQNLTSVVNSRFEDMNSSVHGLNLTLHQTNEQVSSLSSNTSQAIARSNAILTRVIADVNISLTEFKNVSMTYFESMFENFLVTLQTAQANFRRDLNNASDFLRGEVSDVNRSLETSIAYLNSSVASNLLDLANETRLSIMSLNSSIDLLQHLIDLNQRDMESKLHLSNRTLAEHVNSSTASLLNHLNLTTSQVRDEMLNLTSHATSKLEILNHSSAESFEELRRIVSHLGLLLYPPTEETASVGDGSWSSSFKKIQSSRIIFDTIAEQMTNLTSRLNTNLSSVQNQTNQNFLLLGGVVNSTKNDMLASLSETSLFLQSLIQLLNESFVQEKLFTLARSEQLESLLSNNTNRLEVLIHNSSGELTKHLRSYQVEVNETLSGMKSGLMDAILDYRTLSINDTNRLLNQFDLLNQTLQSTNRTLSSDIEQTAQSLFQNTTVRLNATDTKIEMAVKNLTGELELLRKNILHDILEPIVVSNQQRFNETERSISLLNESTSSSIKQLVVNTSNSLISLSQNFTSEVNQLLLTITNTHTVLAEALRLLQLNLTSELLATNSTLAGHDSRLTNLTISLSVYQQSQSDMWKENLNNITLLTLSTLDLISDLNSTLARVETSLKGSLETSVTTLSTEWSKALKESNDSQGTKIEEISRNTSAVFMILNQSFSASLQNLTGFLLFEQTQLEKELKSLIGFLQDNMTLEDSLTRDRLIHLLDTSLQQVNATVEHMNSTLLQELSTLSTNTNLAFRAALENVTKLLDDHTLRLDGKMLLFSHRIDHLENSTKSLSDTSAILTLDSALLKADVGQLAASLLDTKQSHLNTLDTLHGLEIQLINVSFLANRSQEELLSLRSQYHALQSQFAQLSLNTSTNLVILHQIFSAVNNSQQASQLFFEEVRDRTSQLRIDFEKEKIRTERIADEVRNLSLVALPKVLSHIDDLNAVNAKDREQLKERLQGEEKKSAELVAVDEALTKRISTLEQEIRDFKDHEVVNLKKGIEDVRNRCEIMTGDLRKELDRSRSEEDSQDKKIKEMSERLAILETKSTYQDKRIAELVEENEKLRKNMASQSSVDDLRKLIQDLQSSMLSHSNKVLDVVISKLASPSS